MQTESSGGRLRDCMTAIPGDCWGVCAYEDALPLLPCRGAGRIPPAAASILVCLFPYYAGDYPRRNVARYAMLNDYHQVAGKILGGLAAELGAAFPKGSFIPFVDNSPVREVQAARQAGLGVVGKNGLLIHPVYGSYVFIGSIVTDQVFAPSRPAGGQCLLCGSCVRACPTGALAAAGPFNRQLCRSHITQKKGALSSWEREQVRLGGKVWGCDLCGDACPMNRRPAITPVREFRERIAPEVTPENLDRLLPDKPYNYRGRQVVLRNWELVEGSGRTAKE